MQMGDRIRDDMEGAFDDAPDEVEEVEEVEEEAPAAGGEDAGALEPEPEPEPEGQGGELVGDDPRAVRALEALGEILRLMDSHAHVAAASLASQELSVEISGPGAGALIGRHGATLNALQALISIIANQGGGLGLRVTLDAEGYRERRRQMLVRTAQDHAAKAKAAGKEIVIPDLKPHERRIIHLALQDDPEVETYSEGEGEGRYIVISPVS